MSNYKFVWRLELLFALATFAVYVGTAFVLTGDAPVSDWQGWALATALSGARVTVAGLVRPLAAWVVSARGGSNGE